MRLVNEVENPALYTSHSEPNRFIIDSLCRDIARIYRMY